MGFSSTDEHASVETKAPSIAWVLAATLVAGVSGYLVMYVVARAVGAADYSVFGVFWSGLFLVVGVLFGIQQEATRATAQSIHKQNDKESRSSLLLFAVFVAFVVVAIVFGTGLWWGPVTLGAGNASLIVQIAIGSGANAIVATMCGVLAGAQLWRHLGMIIALDGIIRLIGVLFALSVGGSASLLAWAVILPFPLSIGIVFLASPRHFLRLGRSTLSYRQLITNSGHTMLAASATALIINGFPLVLAFFASANEKAALGALILAITITRAPILVPLMALQSFLLTRFTVIVASPWPLIRRAFLIIAIVMVVLGLATLVWGAAAFEIFIGDEFALTTAALVPLVVSSGFIGALCVTGPALLALGLHRRYAAGWVVASLVSIAALFVPLSLEGKAALALSAGPLVGLALHLWFLLRHSMNGRVHTIL